MRIEELRRHIQVESAIVEGAKNALKLIQASKSVEKKSFADVGNCSKS